MNRYCALLAASLTIPALGCSSSHSSGTVLPPVAGMRVAAGRASLNFRPVYCMIPAYAGSGSPAGVTVSSRDCAGSPAAGSQGAGSQGAGSQGAGSQGAGSQADLPTTPAGQDLPSATVILPVDPKAYPGGTTIRYLLGPADLTTDAISDATETVNGSTGQYSVQLMLTKEAATKFDTLAAARYSCYTQNPSSPPPCSEEAFELQGVVESTPTFQASSFNGHVQITGNFTRAQAQALANELKYGSANEHYLPVAGG